MAYKITEQKAIVKRSYRNVTREVTFEEYIGHRFKKARLDEGMTQQELADKLGLTRASICNIEVGRQGVNITMLKKYCDIFRLTTEELLHF